MDRRIAFVVHRYGEQVVGGSEILCRQVAERMARHFQVDVVTTCAVDYVTWKNELSAGVSHLNGVTVRRFPVDYGRGLKFRLLNGLYWRGCRLNRRMQESWMRAQGPYSSALFCYIVDNRNKYDLFIFFTYLYCTTYFGLPPVREKSVLVPTAHDEKPIYLDIFDTLFRLPGFYIFLTEEEKEFVGRRFKIDVEKYPVIGAGIDCPDDIVVKEENLFPWPYLIYAGRVDVGKGCDLLLEYFLNYKKNYGNDLRLVLIGPKHMDIPTRDDIVYLGFVPEKEKWRYLKQAVALVLPSRFESFSLAVLEAMACGVPVLVNGESAVLQGHCRRSGGGMSYKNYDQFSAALNHLLSSESVRREMGVKGRAYVKENYSWSVVEQKYVQAFLDLIEKQRDGS
ncbi:MAG: glycosyltransferase family 4 protein [Pelotomaculum sp.]|nr:glycosyltransferase family 4 protein [Pelotomaculum sp.]